MKREKEQLWWNELTCSSTKVPLWFREKLVDRSHTHAQRERRMCDFTEAERTDLKGGGARNFNNEWPPTPPPLHSWTEEPTPPLTENGNKKAIKRSHRQQHRRGHFCLRYQWTPSLRLQLTPPLKKKNGSYINCFLFCCFSSPPSSHSYLFVRSIRKEKSPFRYPDGLCNCYLIQNKWHVGWTSHIYSRPSNC